MTTTTHSPGVLGWARQRTTAVFAVLALAFTSIAVTATSGGAADGEPESEVVYSAALPAETPSSPSHAFLSLWTNEYGDHIRLDGEQRALDSITVGLNNWACEVDTGNDTTCETATAGAGYTHPITVNVYDVDNSDDIPQPGAQVATVTQDVFVPYRPSADEVNCPDNPQGWFHDASGTCHRGFAFDVDFDFSAQQVDIPAEAIVTVAFPTRRSEGYEEGPWDALNVGLNNQEPSVGANVDSDMIFWNSDNWRNYADDGEAGVSILRHDTGWAPYTPAFEITVATAPSPDPDPTPTPGEPEPGETVTETQMLGETEVTFTAELGDHPSGELVLSSSYSDDPAEFGELPGDAQFSFGAYSFELNVATGSTATVTIETETPANTLFKSIDNEWSEYPATFEGTRITFELVDGGAGDADGVANSIIVDPVAAAIMASFTG